MGWVDVTRVRYSNADNVPYWVIELAARPPRAAGLEPGQFIAYGLVLDTTGDGVAHYLVGIDNDAPQRGDFHVWVTDLRTGETDEQIGPPAAFLSNSVTLTNGSRAMVTTPARWSSLS